MENMCQNHIILSLWLFSSLSFVFCGNNVFKHAEDVREFNLFALDEVLKAVYPLDISDLKHVIDGTVDKEILSSDKVGTYGCLKPETNPNFQYMVRVYSQCELAFLEANAAAERYGCPKKGGHDCEVTISSKVTYSEQATGGWKVGAVASASFADVEISAEYGESWETSKTTEESIQRKTTLSPGQTAIPYVIVAGIECFAEYHGVAKDLIGKLSSKGSDYEDIQMDCEKDNSCLFTCEEFKSDGSDGINNEYSRYKVPRDCIYYKPTNSLYPVTRDPVVPCRTDKPPFFRGNMTMPLYDSHEEGIHVDIVYVTEEKDIRH